MSAAPCPVQPAAPTLRPKHLPPRLTPAQWFALREIVKKGTDYDVALPLVLADHTAEAP